MTGNYFYIITILSSLYLTSSRYIRFLPCNAVLVQYMLLSGDSPSVCPSVTCRY